MIDCYHYTDVVHLYISAAAGQMMHPNSSPVFQACEGLDEEESVLAQTYQNQGAVSLWGPILVIYHFDFGCCSASSDRIYSQFGSPFRFAAPA